MAKSAKNWFDPAPAIGVAYNEEPKAEEAEAPKVEEKKVVAHKAAAKKAPAAKAKADDDGESVQGTGEKS